MAFKAIQFQKGLSMREFQHRFGTEEQCISALAGSRWPDGFECPDCGSREFHRLRARPLFQCAICRHQASVTAGTIFHGTRLPLQLWFLALHLLTQGKHGVSALELKRQLGVCYETAWNLKHKLLQVMMERGATRVLHGRVEADDAYMGGARHEGKRGRGAPGKRPFIAAVQTHQINIQKVLYIKLHAAKNLSGATVNRWAKQNLARGATVLTDGWRSYRRLQSLGFEHHPLKSEGGWRSAKHPSFRWVNTVLGNLKGNILGVYRWVSIKHLPRYLAEFEYRFNRRFDLTTILPRLLRAATLTPPMPHRLLVLAERSR